MLLLSCSLHAAYLADVDVCDVFLYWAITQGETHFIFTGTPQQQHLL